VSFCVLFVCKCVLYYCHRVTTQLQLIYQIYHTQDTQHYYTNNAVSEVDLQAQVQDTARRIFATNCICIMSIPHFTFNTLPLRSRSFTVTQNYSTNPSHFTQHAVRYRIHNSPSVDPTPSQGHLIFEDYFLEYGYRNIIIIIIIIIFTPHIQNHCVLKSGSISSLGDARTTNICSSQSLDTATLMS